MPFWKSKKTKEAVVEPPSILNYYPNHIALGKNEIRLLKLDRDTNAIVQLTFLVPVQMEAPPPYHALSYTWGDASSRDTILIDGVLVWITKNLSDFLHAHRSALRDNIDTIWIDALCINQSDDDEKTVQLPLMREIYEKAQSTIVWLGEDGEEYTKGFELINALPRPTHFDIINISGFDLNPWITIDANRKFLEECWLSFSEIMSLPWFTRIWVKQEYIVSPIVRFQLGSRFFRLEDFLPAALCLPLTKGTAFQEIILRIFASQPKEKWRARQSSINTGRIMSMLLQREERFERKTFHTLPRLLWTFRDDEATQPVDMIYGLLGLPRPFTRSLPEASAFSSAGYNENMLIVNYKAKVEDVYKSVVKSIVAATFKLNILAAAQPNWRNAGPKPLKLPSWTPDWSRPWVGQSLLQPKERFEVSPQAHGGWYRASRTEPAIVRFSDDLNVLYARGFVVDTLFEDWGTLLTKIDGVDTIRPKDHEAYARRARRWREFRSPGAYESTEAGDEALWRTLTAIYDEHFVQDGSSSYADWKAEFNDWISNSSKTYLTAKFIATMRGRRLNFSKAGYFVAAPETAWGADKVCILFGCDVPVILRSHKGGKQHEFIGECYVHAMMGGEMMTMIERDPSKITDFELH